MQNNYAKINLFFLSDKRWKFVFFRSFVRETTLLRAIRFNSDGRKRFSYSISDGN
ncbi:hypothetical protein DOY81_002023, partial [Sarcophaga bullata]